MRQHHRIATYLLQKEVRLTPFNTKESEFRSIDIRYVLNLLLF
jgi:hypothetical protein